MTVDFVIVLYRNEPTAVRKLATALIEGAREAGMAPTVRLVANDDAFPDRLPSECMVFSGHGNAGFARGVDIGLRDSVGEFVVAVNPDCEPKAADVANFLAGLGTGVSVPILIDGDGNCDSNPFANGVFAVGRKIAEARSARYLASGDRAGELPTYMKAPGAFLAIDRRSLDALGMLFDVAFFMYGEDRDLTWRARKNGIPVQLVPVRIVHIGGVSGAGLEAFGSYWRTDASMRVASRRFGRVGVLLVGVDALAAALMRRSRGKLRGNVKAVLNWLGSCLSEPRSIRSPLDVADRYAASAAVPLEKD